MNETHFPSGTLLTLLSESARRSSELHRQFLHMRRNSLQDMQALIETQMRGWPLAGCHMPEHHAIFDSRQLEAFGTGKISQCFGSEFACYDQRRIPRIPNGDLRMMSRITAISGSPREFDRPASIVAEYDVPVDAWYLRDSAYPQVPTSLYMEIALQPCGFLSAYLDSYALVPYEHFYFRNLDGSARVLAGMDLRGKTLTTQARMLSSVVSSGTVIQKFAFELTCEGTAIYAGESVFGYFSAESMANQLGLDGGRVVLPVARSAAAPAQAAQIDTRPLRIAQPDRPYYRLAQGQMGFLDGVIFDPTGGRYGHGYIYASRPVQPADWFYACHFYQDPVMPGSLGVEAILEAMQAYALANGVGNTLRSPHFGPVMGDAPVTWRYRGQITPRNQTIELEVHLKPVAHQAGSIVLNGEASLWVDGLRIYEIQNVALGIYEG